MTTGLQLLSSRDCGLYYPIRQGSGSTIYDQSGNARNGTLVGTPTYNKLIDGVYSITTGGGKYMDYAASGTFISNPTLSGAMCICVWIYSVGTGSYYVMSSGGQTSSTGIYIINSSPINVAIRTTTKSWADYTTFTLPTNEWSFLSMSWDGDDMKVYLNGVLKVENTFYPNVSVSDTYTTFCLGRPNNSTSTSFQFNGQIAYPMIFSRALSLAEIQAIYRTTYIL